MSRATNTFKLLIHTYTNILLESLHNWSVVFAPTLTIISSLFPLQSDLSRVPSFASAALDMVQYDTSRLFLIYGYLIR
jgi:hypothetical protein